MRARNSHYAAVEARLSSPAQQFFRPSQLRKIKGSEQAAAVCYRIRQAKLEFLLVRTRGGRWTFPKGAIESGLSYAQSAALEAFEEAGVHGRIEESCFARYVHRKGGSKDRKCGTRELAVHAHLCEVVRLRHPKESHRNPTWFSIEKTRKRLQQDREPRCAAELVRVVDLAVTRIWQLGGGVGGNERWRQVRFEAFEDSVGAESKIMLGIRKQQTTLRTAPARPQLALGWQGSGAPGVVSAEATRDYRALVRIPRLTAANTAGHEVQTVQVINIADAPRGSRRRSQIPIPKRRKNRLR